MTDEQQQQNYTVTTTTTQRTKDQSIYISCAIFNCRGRLQSDISSSYVPPLEASGSQEEYYIRPS